MAAAEQPRGGRFPAHRCESDDPSAACPGQVQYTFLPSIPKLFALFKTEDTDKRNNILNGEICFEKHYIKTDLRRSDEGPARSELSGVTPSRPAPSQEGGQPLCGDQNVKTDFQCKRR